MRAGKVTLVDWPMWLRSREGNNRVQRAAMNHALYAFGHHAHWMLFLDLDEFLVLPPSLSWPASPPKTLDDQRAWRAARRPPPARDGASGGGGGGGGVTVGCGGGGGGNGRSAARGVRTMGAGTSAAAVVAAPRTTSTQASLHAVGAAPMPPPSAASATGGRACGWRARVLVLQARDREAPDATDCGSAASSRSVSGLAAHARRVAGCRSEYALPDEVAPALASIARWSMPKVALSIDAALADSPMVPIISPHYFAPNFANAIHDGCIRMVPEPAASLRHFSGSKLHARGSCAAAAAAVSANASDKPAAGAPAPAPAPLPTEVAPPASAPTPTSTSAATTPALTMPASAACVQDYAFDWLVPRLYRRIAQVVGGGADLRCDARSTAAAGAPQWLVGHGEAAAETFSACLHPEAPLSTVWHEAAEPQAPLADAGTPARKRCRAPAAASLAEYLDGVYANAAAPLVTWAQGGRASGLA